jgi:hypothetical protein
VDNKTTNTESTEATLRQVLGSPELPMHERQKHRTRLGSVGQNARRRRARSRPLIAIGSALLINLIVIATFFAYNQSDDSSWGIQTVEAAEQMMAEPEAGYGRHTVIKVSHAYTRFGPDREWVMEIWERSDENGASEFKVQARTMSGEVIGTYVQTAKGWALSYGDTVRSGEGRPERVPAELNPLRTSLLRVHAALQRFDRDKVTVDEDGALRVIVIDLTQEDRPGMAFVERQIGEPIEKVLWEVTLDADAERLVNIRLAVVGESGQRTVVNEYTVTTWERSPVVNFDDETFELPKEEVEIK